MEGFGKTQSDVVDDANTRRPSRSRGLPVARLLVYGDAGHPFPRNKSQNDLVTATWERSCVELADD